MPQDCTAILYPTQFLGHSFVRSESILGMNRRQRQASGRYHTINGTPVVREDSVGPARADRITQTADHDGGVRGWHAGGPLHDNVLRYALARRVRTVQSDHGVPECRTEVIHQLRYAHLRSGRSGTRENMAEGGTCHGPL